MKKVILIVVIIFLVFQMVVLATPWDVSTATYAEKFVSVTDEDTGPASIFFNSDGTNLYMLGTQYDSVYQYTLSTGWDVSTATYAEKSVSVTNEDTFPYGLALSADGTKMYIFGTVNTTVFQYTLDPAWDVSTAIYAEKLKDVSVHEDYIFGLAFNADGTKMYVTGITLRYVYQYTLSTGWDVSTATYAEKSAYVGDEDTSPRSVTFSPDGTKMYINGYTNDTVYQYTLSTGWDVSTATYAEKSKDITTEDATPRSAIFRSDGTAMYVSGYANKKIYQYTLLPVGWPHKWNTITIGKWNTKEIVKWNTIE